MKIKLLIVFSLLTLFLKSQDFEKYFIDSGVKGQISIFDLEDQKWTFSNFNRATKGSLPASTFKIIHTLIALEENVIAGKNDTLRWDGKVKSFKSYPIPNWNKDNDLEMAFKNSTIWYYEEISKKIKKSKYRRHLKKNKYSNRKFRNAKGFDFWNYGELKVTPIEQIEMLLKLYSNKLAFKPEFQELTKELMTEQESIDYILKSKTAWTYDKVDIAWYIGYIEFNKNVIFFATRIEKPIDKEIKDFSKLRKSITKEIISNMYDINFID